MARSNTTTAGSKAAGTKKAGPAGGSARDHVIKPLPPPDLTKFPEQWHEHINATYQMLAGVLARMELLYDCCRHGATPSVAAAPLHQWRQNNARVSKDLLDADLMSELARVPVHATKIPDLYITLRQHEQMVRNVWAWQNNAWAERWKAVQEKHRRETEEAARATRGAEEADRRRQAAGRPPLTQQDRADCACLGVHLLYTLDELNAAKRRGLKKHHPDVSEADNADATRRSAELNAAYDRLRARIR